jgi:large repetitive protein
MKPSISGLLLAFAVLPCAIWAQSLEPPKPPVRTSFSATGLPPGISIDPVSGVISGKFDRAAIIDGKMVYDVVVRVTDIGGAHGVTRLRITIPNEIPVAIEDKVSIKSGETALIPVLANDYDADNDGLAIISVAARSSGPVEFSKAGILYRLAKGGPRRDSLIYVISDGHGGTATGRVMISARD